MQREELKIICAYLFEICKAGATANAFTYYYTLFFLTKGTACCTLYYVLRKCPTNVCLVFFAMLAHFFFLTFPKKIKKSYLMNTCLGCSVE